MRVNRRGKELSPRMVKEIIRLKKLGLSSRKIAQALGCSRNTVKKYLGDLKEPAAVSASYEAPWSELIDWDAVVAESNHGVALSESHQNRSDVIPDVPYVTFWREFKRRHPSIPLDLHKLHPPGERCEIDYKGDTPGLGFHDRRTGEFIPCRLFGAVMCFSQLFYARATLSEKKEDVFSATACAFEAFGGVPLTLAFDNAKTCVTRADRYDPDINREFAHLCEHFGTAPLAMRPRKPKDKNLVENALGVFWRWARRRIGMRCFYSLKQLNDYLEELLECERAPYLSSFIS